MAFDSSPMRRFLPLGIVLFDCILAVIAIVNLANGFATESYVSVSYLLCITSILALLTISLISLTNHRNPEWMPYALAFELAWVLVILVLQLIGATAMSADPITAMCHHSGSGYPATVSGHDICPTHQATLAFAWASFLLVITHLVLLAAHLLSLSNECSLPLLTILTTPQASLSHPTSQHHRSAADPERGLPPNSSSSSLTSFSANRPNKSRPPPLNLGKVSVTSLPIYNSHAKNVPVATTKEERRRTKSAPNRHQIMAAQLAADAESAGDTPYTLGHHSNASAEWAPPGEWRTNSNPPVEGLKPFLLGRPTSKQLPALPGQAVTYASRLANPQMAKTSTGTVSVVNRPDPRDRRPAREGEVAADGGFWLSRQMTRI